MIIIAEHILIYNSSLIYNQIKNPDVKPNVYLIRENDDGYEMALLKEGTHKKAMFIYKTQNKMFYPIERINKSTNKYINSMLSYDTIYNQLN